MMMSASAAVAGCDVERVHCLLRIAVSMVVCVQMQPLFVAVNQLHILNIAHRY